MRFHLSSLAAGSGRIRCCHGLKDQKIYLYIGITSLYLKDTIQKSGLQDGILAKAWPFFLWKIQIFPWNAEKTLTPSGKM